MWIINPNHREDRSIHTRTKRSWWCPTRCGGGLGELAEPNCPRYLPLLFHRTTVFVPVALRWWVRATVPLAHSRCASATRHPMSSFPLPLLTLTRTLHAPHWFRQKAIVIIFDHGFDVGGGFSVAPNPSPARCSTCHDGLLCDLCSFIGGRLLVKWDRDDACRR